jgi:hypothetical protein
MRNIYGSLSKEEVRRVISLLQRPLAALESTARRDTSLDKESLS